MSNRSGNMSSLWWLVISAVMASWGCTAPGRVSPALEKERGRYNTVAGTQTILPAYGFTDQDRLLETARIIRAMGSTTLKMALTARYCTVEYHLPRDPSIRTLRDLVERQPSVRAVLDMDFSSYVFWAYAFSQYRGGDGQQALASFQDGFTDAEAAAVYREVYDLAAWLLTTYSGSGKRFYIGHWEGDWHLRWDYDTKRPLRPKTVEGMIRWLETRQRAIDDARRETPHRDVAVYGYTEVNLVQRGMRGDPCATTEVLPRIDVDYVSYSAWDTTNYPRSAAAMRAKLLAALDFIEAHLRPLAGLPPGKRVWIGEFGYPAIKFSAAEADLRTRWVIRAGLEWGCPFVLYWELYNNEVEPDGTQRGYWMIDAAGRQMPVYRTYRCYYREAGGFLRDFMVRTGRLPTQQELRDAALSFPSLFPGAGGP